MPLLIVGAGAAGLCAALAAKEAGVDAVVVERDAVPSGSTALSAGLIPAAGTRFQRAKGIADSAALFAADIQRKAHGEADPAVVEAVAKGAGPLVEWLADRYGLPFDVVDNFNYPGHSALRMHGLPSRTGRELIDRLRSAAEANDIVILTERVAEHLFADPDGRIRGVELLRGDGARERIGCGALILACNGYGGNPELVRRFIPRWRTRSISAIRATAATPCCGAKRSARNSAHLGGYQGHGSVATPHNILITWAVMMQGGIQVNSEGRRFCDELRGYSEQAADVLRQPGGIAWDVFDARIAAVARQFEDFREAERAGAVLTAAERCRARRAMHVPASGLTPPNGPRSNAQGEREAAIAMGGSSRREQPCAPPFHAVKVTGALFHTQGGLAIDAIGRVKRKDGTLFPNLSRPAARRPACRGDRAGYLSGNGLLTATVLGRSGSNAAAKQVAK